MENLSQPVETVVLPVAIPVPAYLRDHLVSGRVVLPAAEALQILARTLPATAGVDPCRQGQGVFSHLLYIDPQVREIQARHELSRYADGRCLSRLATLLSGRQANWTRRIEHVSVFFEPSGGEKEGRGHGPQAVFAGAAALEGPVFNLSGRRLYDELVPFGPAYQNVAGDVCLAKTGASADVSGGGCRQAAGPLGSPFPFDAALHVACAWGQRYRNTVAFPVGFSRREIILPTRAGKTYSCRVIPLPGGGASLRFDVWLYGADRQPVEVIRGIEMRDISGGRRKPPDWVREGG